MEQTRQERRAERQRKNPRKSKTLIVNAIAAGLGALELSSPGSIPHIGPALMVGLPVINAILRVFTSQPIR